MPPSPPTDDPPRPVPDRQVLAQVGPALLVLALSVAATYVVPQLSRARPWRPGDPVPFWNLLGRPFESAGPEVERNAALARITQEALRPPKPPPPRRPPPGAGTPYAPDPEEARPPPVPLDLPREDALDPFFAALARADDGVPGAVARVVHFGDSAIGVDGIPQAVRARMQARFGDAGHGFHAIAPPNTSYRHREVQFTHNERWHVCFIIKKCLPDGHYGLGGVVGRSAGGAESRFAPSPKYGSGRVGSFTIYYAAHPRGGKLQLRVDDGPPRFLSTRAPTLEDRFETIDLKDGPHTLEVRAAGGGRVRVYGVTLDRRGPGVSWDGLALVGAFTRRMLEFDPEHLRRQLARRGAHLAVLTFGGNDLVRNVSPSRYEEEYRAVLRHLRSARPEMACLVMAPLDHGIRKGRRILSVPALRPMVEAQRRAAAAEGCAFFDTVAAMGGANAAERWYRHRPRLLSGDLAHATPAGQQVLGELLYRAIVHAYVRYRMRGGAANKKTRPSASPPPETGDGPAGS